MIDFPEINEFSSSILLMYGVVLLKIMITRLVSHHPLKGFSFYCQKLADKVNNSSNSTTQQTIAGFVAIMVTLAPLITILWLFEAFIEVKWLWQGLLLYCAIGPFSIMQTSKSLAQALVANQQYLAKQTLKPLVLRDTEQLSNIGLSKSCIEMQLISTLQQNIVVLFYFLLFGPLPALTYRLLLEMHYSWNIKLFSFHHFGKSISYTVNLLQWLPVRLFTLVMLLSSSGQHLLLFWRLIRGKFFQLNNDISIHCFALCLGIKLGGVAMYQGIKLRRISFNDQAKQPDPTDIIHASNCIKLILFLGAIVLIIIGILTFFLQKHR